MADRSTSATAAPGPSLRAERDRFVALAFCWADVLVELDARESVVFAAGPTASLIGLAPEALVGLALDELVAAADLTLMRELLGLARKRGRIEDVAIRLRGAKGVTAPMSFAGYRLEELQDHYFLAFQMGAPARAGDAAAGPSRDAESGLMDADSFAEVVTRRLGPEGTEGEFGQMTLIELPNFDELRGRLDAEGEQNLLKTVGAFLRANSVDGDAAARIADDRYGLIHAGALDVAHLERKIGEFAGACDPTGAGCKVESATVEVEGDGVSDEDLANGLVYAINRFRKSEGERFSIRQLSTNISALVSEAAQSVNTFKRVVSAADFEIALQPIIHVMTGEVHHYEALVRFGGSGQGQSPYEYITFAEETGLIQEFDLAMAGKVVEWLSRTPRNAKTSVAVNVSGHSVGSIAYMTGLQALLADNLWLRGRLLFEITESARMTDLAAANHFIQNLRSEGYPVCLDDFGAGAANFQYLSTMEVDIVKLDGSAVRNAQKAQKGRAFLKSLAGLCRDIGVETIAEMVDDEGGLRFIRECGVQYVQGYLFGKPSNDIKSFEKLRHRSLFPAWRG